MIKINKITVNDWGTLTIDFAEKVKSVFCLRNGQPTIVSGAIKITIDQDSFIELEG